MKTPESKCKLGSDYSVSTYISAAWQRLHLESDDKAIHARVKSIRPKKFNKYSQTLLLQVCSTLCSSTTLWVNDDSSCIMTKSFDSGTGTVTIFPRGLTHFLCLSGVYGFGNLFPRAFSTYGAKSNIVKAFQTLLPPRSFKP